MEPARRALQVVRSWLSIRELVVVGDQTYAALEWLAAALDQPAPPRPPRQSERPRNKGKKLPTLEQVLTDSRMHGTTGTMVSWSGGAKRRVPITSNTAV